MWKRKRATTKTRASVMKKNDKQQKKEKEKLDKTKKCQNKKNEKTEKTEKTEKNKKNATKEREKTSEKKKASKKEKTMSPSWNLEKIHLAQLFYVLNCKAKDKQREELAQTFNQSLTEGECGFLLRQWSALGAPESLFSSLLKSNTMKVCFQSFLLPLSSQLRQTFPWNQHQNHHLLQLTLAFLREKKVANLENLELQHKKYQNHLEKVPLQTALFLRRCILGQERNQLLNLFQMFSERTNAIRLQVQMTIYRRKIHDNIFHKMFSGFTFLTCDRLILYDSKYKTLAPLKNFLMPPLFTPINCFHIRSHEDFEKQVWDEEQSGDMEHSLFLQVETSIDSICRYRFNHDLPYCKVNKRLKSKKNSSNSNNEEQNHEMILGEAAFVVEATSTTPRFLNGFVNSKSNRKRLVKEAHLFQKKQSFFFVWSYPFQKWVSLRKNEKATVCLEKDFDDSLCQLFVLNQAFREKLSKDPLVESIRDILQLIREFLGIQWTSRPCSATPLLPSYLSNLPPLDRNNGFFGINM